MSYTDQVLASQDIDLHARIAACAAGEGFPEHAQPALGWADLHQWAVCAQPGVADAYASALAGGVLRPGWDSAVITDGMLLSACTAVHNEGAPDA
jgi:hypothetical protein